MFEIEQIGGNLLVILNVLIQSTKLAGLEDAESNKENNAKNEWIDTTQNQILHLKVTTCNRSANMLHVLMQLCTSISANDDAASCKINHIVLHTECYHQAISVGHIATHTDSCQLLAHRHGEVQTPVRQFVVDILYKKVSKKLNHWSLSGD